MFTKYLALYMFRQGLGHGIHAIIIIFMLYMIYCSKYDPGRVGIEECSLDLMFLIRDRPLGFQVGAFFCRSSYILLAETSFFKQLKTRFFFRQSESIYFLVTIERLLTSAIRPKRMLNLVS